MVATFHLLYKITCRKLKMVYFQDGSHVAWQVEIHQHTAFTDTLYTNRFRLWWFYTKYVLIDYTLSIVHIVVLPHKMADH